MNAINKVQLTGNLGNNPEIKIFDNGSKLARFSVATTEEFTTRRKIAEPYKNIYLAIGYAITLGLGELIWFPHQLYVAGRRSIVGQQLRFTYDSEGHVTGIRHDGDAVIGVGPPHE